MKAAIAVAFVVVCLVVAVYVPSVLRGINNKAMQHVEPQKIQIDQAKQSAGPAGMTPDGGSKACGNGGAPCH